MVAQCLLPITVQAPIDSMGACPWIRGTGSQVRGFASATLILGLIPGQAPIKTMGA